MFYSSLAAVLLAIPAFTTAQSADVRDSVGPLTTIAEKTAVKTCDITDYGAEENADISTALNDAFTACASGGVVIIPTGNWELENWVDLSGGNAWALQMDGIITRTGTAGGNMIYIEHSTDFEMYSTNSAGAVQGLGYEFHIDGNYDGPRILRLYDVTSFSVHDIILVDSPSFHFSMDTCTQGEVYNMAIRGGNAGGLDGIDVWSDTMWIHDVEVTNKDECVTVKSPSTNILVENIDCNSSGGCAMGSLGSDTAISNITYSNIYTWSSNQMYMIKSYGGNGTVENVVLENFIGHGNAYSLDINQYWSSMSPAPGNGVLLNNILISNWTGTEADGSQRGPINIICNLDVPCTNIDLVDVNLWTEEGDEQFYNCQSAYTSERRNPAVYCLQNAAEADQVAYSATTRTVTTAPTGYAAPSMANDLQSIPWGTTASIPIPTIPSSFFPGATPYSALASSS